MANRIREIRKSKGMTLFQLAEKLGVSESTVQRYESGNIRNLKYETMTDLAIIFDCSPSYVMGWENSTETNIHIDIKITDDEIKSIVLSAVYADFRNQCHTLCHIEKF